MQTTLTQISFSSAIAHTLAMLDSVFESRRGFNAVVPTAKQVKRVEKAREPLNLFSLTECEVDFIVQTAIKRKINLADVGLENLDSVQIAYKREGLFTYVYLVRLTDDDNYVVKVGVTKKHAKEEENPEIAVKTALWRAVLSPAIVL